MAARAPRKAAPRKAPARKPPPKTVEEKIDAFEELRAIAPDYGIGAPVTTPYVLGAEFGFDPPIEARYPATLVEKVTLDRATRSNDVINALSILFGDAGLLRVVEKFGTQPDGERLLLALYIRITNHFMGKGAYEVGGTPAS